MARAVPLIVLGIGATVAVANVAQAQERTRLTGTVMDSVDKRPIGQASVVVTGTTYGAATNDNGQFTIALPSDAKTLTVRRIGYRQSVVAV
ncbi:MAG TPA: carboxypeptidase-like regulatory domain-containing protein, partial [Gemmatimonadaceae bacterium]|nr:carboxypeptidase-like regulatory domain-containing protein [Gemmatimonadaceae bacterium]